MRILWLGPIILATMAIEPVVAQSPMPMMLGTVVFDGDDPSICHLEEDGQRASIAGEACLAVAKADGRSNTAHNFSMQTPFPVEALPKAQRPRPVGNSGDWFSLSDYPRAPGTSGLDSGRVTLVLDVDRAGHATACKVLISSGHAYMDDATCKLALRKAHYNAAMDINGKAMPSHPILPVIWWTRG